MRARYYNVDIKRFINQDVVEGSITNSPSLNKYAYCQGNPVNQLDPFGLSPQGVGSFVGHLVLDALGYIPVVGIFADIANGIWYIAEGNYFCAAMSFIAAIPLIGDAFGLTAEGAKYACTFNKLIFGTKALGNLATFGRSLSQISAISADITQKLLSGEDWELEDTIEVVTGLGYIAEAMLSAYDLGINLNAFSTISNQCFVAGTLVLTIDGNKPIEEIKAGDLVYSTNPETGESEYKEVARVFRRESDIIIHVFVNGEEIETTPNHPFWVEDQWVNAKDLREGDVLSLADGTTATITKTYGEQVDEPVIVYNFEVQDFHTYYVTDIGVLVHNANKTYQTYTKTNPETGEVYSGRTSGTGTPEENVYNRDRNHHMNDQGFGPAVLDQSSDNYAAIRGREQMLIDSNGGAKSTGGTSGNAINGISNYNPKHDYYIESARGEFGNVK